MTDIIRIPSDGLMLTVEMMGDGPPLIFAHGLTGNRQGVLRQLAPLADHYRIITYDQRGHGDSTPVTDPALYDPHRMAADMATVLDTLKIERAIVGGESMGAATTLLFALRWPERVDTLLLTAPAFGDRPNAESQRLKDMGRGILGLGMDGFRLVAADRQREVLGWPPAAIEYVGACFASHPPASLATALQTVPDWKILADLSILNGLHMPTCILAWDGDAIHPLDLAQNIAAAFPNARLTVIPTLPEIFVNPTVVGTSYAEFLAQVNKEALP